MYLQNVWFSLFGEELKITIATDSSAGLAMSCRRGCGRVRHLEIRQLYIQGLTNSGRVAVVKEKGTKNVADLGTKALDAATIATHLIALGYKRFVNERLVELEIKRAKKTPGTAVGAITQAGRMALIAQLFGFGEGVTEIDIGRSDTTPLDYFLLGAMLSIIILQFGLICWLCCCRHYPGGQKPRQGVKKPARASSPDAPARLDAESPAPIFLSPAGLRFHVSPACSSLKHLQHSEIRVFEGCRICGKKNP